MCDEMSVRGTRMMFICSDVFPRLKLNERENNRHAVSKQCGHKTTLNIVATECPPLTTLAAGPCALAPSWKRPPRHPHPPAR